MNEKIQEAREFAITMHGKQKYQEHNYVYHLDQVYSLICEAGLDESFQIGSFTHDILEDTDCTYEKLAQKFDENIAKMSFSVSGFGENRKARHEDIKNKLTLHPEYVDLKMADRIVNMRNCVLFDNKKLLSTYMNEMDSFKEVFSLGNSYLKDIFAKEFNYTLPNKIKKLSL